MQHIQGIIHWPLTCQYQKLDQPEITHSNFSLAKINGESPSLSQWIDEVTFEFRKHEPVFWGLRNLSN